MVRASGSLWVTIAMLPLMSASLVAAPTAAAEDLQAARRELGQHDRHRHAGKFSVDGHKCYKAGCEKYDKHRRAWVKDPHCCSFCNGFAGRHWTRCSEGVLRSTITRALDFRFAFAGQLHVGSQCAGALVGLVKDPPRQPPWLKVCIASSDTEGADHLAILVACISVAATLPECVF